MMRKITRLAERSEALKAMSRTLDFTQNDDYIKYLFDAIRFVTH